MTDATNETTGSEGRESEEGVYRGTKETKALITCKGVSKSYWKGKEQVKVLEDLDLTVAAGSFIALMGPSGSGKTTLLNLIAGLDVASGGSLQINGKELTKMKDSARARWRSENVGFVFQTYNLLPVLTAQQNVELPLLLTKLSGKERKERARTALRVVGLEDRVKHLPRELSGGQAQRVSVARAIVNDPMMIVADEPTGDLDRENADEILDLLVKLNKEFGKTIVMVTHDPAAAERAETVRHLDKGRFT